MIIKRMYYGRHEISSIILNGKTIWRSWEKLNISYDVRLTVDSEEDAYLTEVILKEILSGEISWTIEQSIDNNGLSSKLICLDYIVNVNCRIELVDANNTVVPVILGDCDVENSIVETGPIHGMVVDVVVQYNDDVVTLCLYSAKNGNSASAVHGAYILDDKYQTIYQRSGLSFTAISGGHTIETRVTERQDLYSNSSLAVLYAHNNDVYVNIRYLDTGESIIAKAGYHLNDTDVTEVDEVFGVSAPNISNDYISDLFNHETDECYGSESNAIMMDKHSKLTVREYDVVFRTIVTPTYGDKLSTVTPVSTIDGSATTVNNASADGSSTNTFVDVIEGIYSSVPISNVIHDMSGLHTDMVANADELTVVGGVSDVPIVIDEMSGTHCESTSSVSSDHIYATSIDETDSLALRSGNYAEIGYVANDVYHIETVAYLDTEEFNDAPDYIYPTRTETNLYVRQIYAAVPNGTNLNFSSNAIV